MLKVVLYGIVLISIQLKKATLGGFTVEQNMNILRLIIKKKTNLLNLLPRSTLVIETKSKEALEPSLSYDIRLFKDKRFLPLKVSSPIPIIKRFKYRKTPKDEESDEEFDNEDDGESKLIIGHVQSLRVDGVLKSGLGMARNKIETCFYESKIRVNGIQIQKKSHKVKVGDEIDLIKGKNHMNESLLNISRVVLVSVKENEDGDKLKIKMKRYKDMTVEDYSDPWNAREH